MAARTPANAAKKNARQSNSNPTGKGSSLNILGRRSTSDAASTYPRPAPASATSITSRITHAHQGTAELRRDPKVDLDTGEVLRHDADDGESLASQHQPLANRACGLAMPPGRQPVTNDHGLRSAVQILLRNEGSASG